MKELRDLNKRAMAIPPTEEGYLDRLREVGRKLGYRSLTSFQAVLGFSNGYFRNMGRINGEAEARIQNRFPEVNIEYLRTGKGEIFLDKSEKKADEFSIVPLLPIAAIGGSLNDFDASVGITECEKVISPVKNVSLALTVSGDSMSPEYPNGSTIFVQRINDRAFIEWGRTYVLDTVNGVVVKNVFPCEEDEEKVICRSINPNYAEFAIRKEYIRGWYRVLLQMALK